MHALMTSLTTLGVLMHVLLGCHAHHGHAQTTRQATAAVEHAHVHSHGSSGDHGTSEDQAPSPVEDCEDHCDFAASKIDAPTLDDGDGLPLVSDVASVNHRVLLASAAEQPRLTGATSKLGLSVLYCVLRN